ncbi:hypothetical protein WJX82_008664 [Trebouxia sp. C0006]
MATALPKPVTAAPHAVEAAPVEPWIGQQVPYIQALEAKYDFLDRALTQTDITSPNTLQPQLSQAGLGKRTRGKQSSSLLSSSERIVKRKILRFDCTSRSQALAGASSVAEEDSEV